MNAPTPFVLPPLLDAAVQRLKQAVRSAGERTAESLGLSAMAAQNAFQRDALLSAQFELNRKMAAFDQAFAAAFDEQVARECGPRTPGGRDPNGSDWDALSLVENRELEIKVQAERFGLEISHACEWELRELEAYVGSVLGHARAERERNPLRPEIVGHGVIRAVESIVDRPDVRKVLDAELNRSLSAVLRTTYGEIVSDFRKAGVQPVSLSVRTTESRGEHSRSVPLDGSSRERGAERSMRDGTGDSRHSVHGDLRDSTQSVSGSMATRSSGGSFDPASGRRSAAMSRGSSRGTPIGQVDPGMMDLLRKLAFVEPRGAEDGTSIWNSDAGAFASAGGMPPNLIHANRDELRQASRGAIDHMVIDVIANLFDQILADPNVPPQLARQIARLQLPVLRAALGDPSFFSTRKHPVRQFINRIASLGNSFEDFSDEQAKTFVAKVRDLVQEIVKGEFDQIETYEVRLAALEVFVAEQARSAVESHQAGATALLQQREEALRLDRHYAQRLDDELQPLAAPTFVRDFVSRVWSRVILKAAEREGVTSDRVRELRQAGRELFMSVQPKTSPAQRKAFLADLPKLMQQINGGLNAIGWPDERRRAFFAQLMPAHAEALKAQTGTVLNFNMLARQVDHALERGMPTRADLPPASAGDPVDDEPEAPAFTREEAARIGFVDESAVNWDGQVDIDLSAPPEITAVDLELPGLPSSSEPIEPTHGRSLADHVQIGFSYQMMIEQDWQKVRLVHVSPGRSFFVFTRGQRHQRTISLTHRMLARLCESGRMRAFESAQLLERATARTRRQLAGLSAQAAR
jgi:hypothetical protein